MEQIDKMPASRVINLLSLDSMIAFSNLCTAKEGYYTLKTIFPLNNRLLEMGFIPGKIIYVIQNNILGIKIRLGTIIYLLNNVVASSIYVEKLEE